MVDQKLGLEIELLHKRICHALADPTRILILYHLAEEPRYVNELVEAVKVSVIPGEKLEVEIQHEGQEKKQGVGYMPDGTMTVVKNAKELVGKTVNAKVLRVIQSKAGKIIFCDIIDDNNEK